jgi:hypothetical protein
MIRALGSAKRLPAAPAARSTAPIEAACPTQSVVMSGRTYCMVSYIARPAVTDPPGEFTYMWMSFSGSSASRKSSWAITRLATSSVISCPRKMIRSRSRRE